MKLKISNRQFISAAILIFYLIPFLFYASFFLSTIPHLQSWRLFSSGLLLVFGGSLALIILLFYWEKSIQESKRVAPPKKEDKVTSLDSELTFDTISYNPKETILLETALKASLEEKEELLKNLEIKAQEIEVLRQENKQFEIQAHQISQDFADYKVFSEEQLKQKYLQMTALQQLTEDQRAEMEKRQDQIYQLDSKIHDLSYEIKTLLYLNEEEVVPSKPKELETIIPIKEETFIPLYQPNQQEFTSSFEPPIRIPTEAFALLKKCISMAQKLTGANYHSNEVSRYREYSSSYYAIDQRRLFDSLRGENRAMIIVYSQKEHKLLFVNNESKKLLGWSPEKFIEDFSMIMQESITDWRKALSLLAGACDSQARLLAKSKEGQEIILNCHLGVIPTGLFRNYVIGILYPIDTYAQV